MIAALADRWLRVGLFLAVAVATRVWQYGNPVVHVDDQFYLLVGDRMWAGALPYVDIWDRKPVGLFLIYAAIRALPGDGVLAYQLVATLFAAATAWVIARIAGRIATPGAATLAGVAYLATLGAFGGDGGQSPVFYNLFMALAALAMLRAIECGRTFAWGCGAMALAGLAMQVKYTALFEGLFFGLTLVWQARRDRRLAAMAAAWAAVALTPTALALGWYAAIGHADEFWFANFASIFRRHDDGLAVAGVRLASMAGKLLPFAAAALLARHPWTARPGRTTAQAIADRFVLGWCAAAIVGVLVFGSWWDHYALPLLPPLTVAAAPALTRRRGAVGVAVIAWGLAFTAIAIPKHRLSRGDGTAARQIAAFAASRLHGRCLFVYENDPWLYAMAHSCLPSTRAFPDHLNNWREHNATGIDTAAEVARIMAQRPPVVIATDVSDAKTNVATWRIVRAALARDYRPARAWQVGPRRQVAFVPRER